MSAPSQGTRTMKIVQRAFLPPLMLSSRKMSARMWMRSEIQASRIVNQKIETITSQNPKSSDMSTYSYAGVTGRDWTGTGAESRDACRSVAVEGSTVTVGRDGIDHQEVDGDHDERPQGIGRHEDEVGDGARHREHDGHDPGPHRTPEERPARAGHEDAQDQVDPPPRRVVDAHDEAVLADLVVVLVEDADEAGDRVEAPEDEHHGAGEHDPARPCTARGTVLVAVLRCHRARCRHRPASLSSCSFPQHEDSALGRPHPPRVTRGPRRRSTVA